MDHGKLESVGGEKPPSRKKPGWEWWELKMEKIDQSGAKMASGLINPDLLKCDHSEMIERSFKLLFSNHITDLHEIK